MISHLHLQNLGPVPNLELDFAPRLNVITGDNVLGKTLLLDMAWYGMSRTWPEDRPALPNFDAAGEARIEAVVAGAGKKSGLVSARYDRPRQEWRWGRTGKPVKPGLLVYARIDGGFSIWDPARDYRFRDDGPSLHAGEPLRLTRAQVWDGEGLCLGLLLDWESWRLSDNGAWKLFKDVLEALSPAIANSGSSALAAERLIPLPAERIQVSDPKPTPFLGMPYGKVPVTQCSAGMRRILAMGYMLVWSWLRHQEDAKLLGEEPTNSIVLLWDEVEAHLHPQWQRLILPAMMRVASSILLGDKKSNVQIIATTHAPLVLASIETWCDSERDQLLNLHLDDSGTAHMDSILWAKYGDVTGWLTSPAIHMSSGYSAEAERAIQASRDLIAGRRATLNDKPATKQGVHRELQRTLRDTDPFWRFWMAFYQEKS
jgi:hypothetical protein